MADIKITNVIKFYIMMLLYERPKYGYEIIKEVGEKTGKTVSPGDIYPFFKKLKKHGYIKVEETGLREKKVYQLTGSGKAFVKIMLEKFGGLIELAIEPKLTVCAHCGCKVYTGGYKEKIKGKMLSFCCMYCAESFKKNGLTGI